MQVVETGDAEAEVEEVDEGETTTPRRASKTLARRRIQEAVKELRTGGGSPRRRSAPTTPTSGEGARKRKQETPQRIPPGSGVLGGGLSETTTPTTTETEVLGDPVTAAGGNQEADQSGSGTGQLDAASSTAEPPAKKPRTEETVSYTQSVNDGGRR